MSERILKRLLDEGGYLESDESRTAYAYDGSGLEAIPRLVLRPTNMEQIRRILVQANQLKLSIVPRGAGTGTRAGVVRHDAVVVEMRAFSKVERLDLQRNTVTVGAGATLAGLNKFLATHERRFPLDPGVPRATIGGCASQNHVTEESFGQGDYKDLVESVECFDGLGRLHILKGPDVSKVIGWEGTTGIITKLTIKIAPLPKQQTCTIIEASDASEAIVEGRRLSQEGLVILEYFDDITSGILGLGSGPHVLAVYENDRGSVKDEFKVEQLLAKRKRLIPLLWDAGFVAPEGATMAEEHLESFIELCGRNNLPCYGHLGLGVLYTQLKSIHNREIFWTNTVAAGALPKGNEGWGRLTSAYVPSEVRKEANQLKEERDYNQVLNPYVLISEQKIIHRQEQLIADSVRRMIYTEENDAYLATRDERISNRHIRYLLSKGIISPLFYKAQLNNRGTLDSGIIEMRRKLVERGVETKANHEMILKLRQGKVF